MRFLFIVAFLITLLLPGIAEGRIGWTKQQCIESFGEPVMQIAPRLVKSEGQADVFKTDIDEYPVRVIVEYRAGKVWMITYSGRGVRKNRAASLVDRNAGSDDKNERSNVKERSFLRVQHWIEKEKGIHAVYFTSPVQRLIVMNANSLRAEKNPSVPVILEPDIPADDATDPAGEKKPVPSTDPLEQFKCSMLIYNSCRIG